MISGGVPTSDDLFRQVKRIDSVQRSFIYSNFGEMLTGMASVRAYRRQDVFVTNTEKACDHRAHPSTDPPAPC